MNKTRKIWIGIGAFILAVLPNLPGFLVQVKALDGATNQMMGIDGWRSR